MSTLFKLCSWLLATACSTSLGAVCTGEWNGGGVPDNDWSVPGNWSTGCSPQADGDSASFGLNGPTSVNLDIPVILTNLTFENPSQDYTINPTIGGIPAMTMESFGGINPTVNVDSGNQTFNQTLGSISGDTLFVNVDGTLNINANWEGSSDLVIDGTGTINTGSVFIVMNSYTQNGTTVNANGAIINGAVVNTINGGVISGDFNLAETGSLVVNGGIINNNVGDISPPLGLTMNGGILNNFSTMSPSQVTMNGGDFNNDSPLAITNAFTINGGTFVNETDGNISANSFVVNNGTFVNQAANAFISSVGPITVNGGTVINQANAQFNSSDILTINGGLFQSDGDVDALSSTVNSPGIVTGTGFFNQPSDQSFTNNGTVIPGDLPGALTFSSYTQTAAGDLVINVLDSTVFSSIVSTSTADLAGTLTVAPYPGFAGQAIGTPLTIVTAPAGVSGTFSSIVDLFPSLRAEVTYFPRSVVLELFPILSSFISFKEVTFSTINQINLLLANHMDRMIDPCCYSEYCVQLYVDPFGAAGKVHSRNDVSGYRFNTGGVLLGVDMFLSDGGIGLAFDYERVSTKNSHDFGDFSSQKYHFSGYATYLIDSCIQLDAIVGAGWETNRLRRSTGFFGDESARGSPTGDSFDAYVGAEYFVNVCDMNITPLVGLQYIYYRVNRFEESGVEFFDYVYEKQHYDFLRPFLGFKLNRPFNVSCFQIVPQINAAWQYECLDRRKTLIATNTDTFGLTNPILIPRGAQNIVLAGADLAVLYDRYSVDLSYEYEGSKRYYNHFFYLELAAAF